MINRTQPLLHRNLSERRELLRQHFEPVDFEFQFAKSSDCENTEDIQAFLDESVKDGCEGLMVKMLESEASYYEPSRRSVNWLKVSTLHRSLLAKLKLFLATVEKGLLGWRRRLTRPCRCRWLLWERQTDEHVRCIPPRVLRRRLGRIPNHLQNWHWVQRRSVGVALCGIATSGNGEGTWRHQGGRSKT